MRSRRRSELRFRNSTSRPRIQLHQDGGVALQEDHPLLVQFRRQGVSFQFIDIGCSKCGDQDDQIG